MSFDAHISVGPVMQRWIWLDASWPRPLDSKLVAKELQWVSLVNGLKFGFGSFWHRQPPWVVCRQVHTGPCSLVDEVRRQGPGTPHVHAFTLAFPGTLLELATPTIAGSVVRVASHVLNIQLRGAGTRWVLAGFLATRLSSDALQQLGPSGCQCWQGWGKGVRGFLWDEKPWLLKLPQFQKIRNVVMGLQLLWETLHSG